MRFTPSRHIIALLALLLASAPAMLVNGQRTTRRGLSSPSLQKTAPTPPADTIVCDADSALFTFAGFDKPLRSGVETVFVSNRLGRRLTGVEFTIDYFDLSGRKLHSRTLTVGTDIPAGETRQISFRTWDRQQSFYYLRSSKPRRADGTPFDVVVTPRRAICAPEPETTKNSSRP